MNVKNVRRSGIGFLAFALLGAASIGCSSEAEPQESIAPAIEGTLLFKDPSASGPRLDIYSFNGTAAVAITGPVGTEEAFAGTIGMTSLEDIYRALHPEAAVPTELVAVAERLAPKLAELRAQPRAEVEPAEIDKTEAGFRAAVCKGFREGSNKYTPIECPWKASGTSVGIVRFPATIQALDRTYAWNPNNRPATVNWFTASNATLAAAHTFPAFTWTWLSVLGGGPFWADVRPAAGVAGELGLTHHSYTFL